MQTIQIFACDHRKGATWDLPYVRFGGPESECALKTGENQVLGVSVNADETPKLFWLWKHLDELGSPDYVGYCQYRRFFTAVNAGLPVVDIPREKFKREFALGPTEQLVQLVQTGADGILHPHFKVIDD